MKVVVYHADSHYPNGKPLGDSYKRLFKGFNKNCHGHGLTTIHLTLEGFEGWGDENIYYPGLDPWNVILNREVVFTEFLKAAPMDVYFFSEPDYRMFTAVPPLKTDVAMLYRHSDGVPLNPSWRLATPKALPLFELFRDETASARSVEGWHCDSEGFTSVWKQMGSPEKCEVVEFLGLSIELREFSDYVKPNIPKYGKNYCWNEKEDLLEAEGF